MMAWPDSIAVGGASYVSSVGSIFAAFVHHDSGCRSWGVALNGERWFLKASIEPRALPALTRAVEIHRVVTHEAIVPLRDHIVTPDGLVLVYPWVDGDVLYGAGAPTGPAQWRAPGGPHARFRQLPVGEILDALDALFDAHVALADAGFVAVDLYDGSFIYDFDARRMRMCDLDEYRHGPFIVDDDRLPGSTRFMAPEEFHRGATIDERTTVFGLGRTALVLLDEGEVGTAFRGGSALAAVASRATRHEPRDRYPSVGPFVAEWRAAVGMLA